MRQNQRIVLLDTLFQPVPMDPLQTPLNSSERRGDAPDPRAGVPLQPGEDHGGASITLQPLRSRDLAETVGSGEKSTQEQVFWICGGSILEQSIPEGLHSLERTHSGAILQELQPVGQSHTGAVHKEMVPWQALHTGARQKCEEVLTMKTTCCGLTASPIPHLNAHRVEVSGMKELSLGRTGFMRENALMSLFAFQNSILFNWQ